jgi:hypothetical protein
MFTEDHEVWFEIQSIPPQMSPQGPTNTRAESPPAAPLPIAQHRLGEAEPLPLEGGLRLLSVSHAGRLIPSRMRPEGRRLPGKAGPPG